MASGTRTHNRISFKFSKILDDALADRRCEVYIADVKVQVKPSKKYFYPDVVITCDERDTEPQLILFPCLIIEVLSPSTEAYEPLSETLRERGFKFSQYRKLESLQEYILVQVERTIVEVFQRNQDGQWVFSEYGLGDR